MILLPYRFCGDNHHAFAFPFVLIFLPLRLSCKESSTSNQAFSIVFTTPSVPLVGDRNLRRKDVTALRCSEPLRSKVGGPKRSSPYCAGWDRLTVMEISAYVLYQIIQNANLNELILLHYCSYQTNQKCIIFYMAFHIVLPVAFQRMRIIFFRYLIAFCQKLNYPHKRFYKFFIILKTLIIFLELRGLSNFFHKPYSSIDAMKLSKLSTRTTPAS